ncbi:ATP-binding protein [Nocardia africana]|uniref:ATP-binding protein n=1 Tax=Nocardia africana TaxID=134964 RepID=A0ABW6NBU9_9NOCA
MKTSRTSAPDFVQLVENLRAQKVEREWLEFKTNLSDPKEIGEYVSALANAAALCGEPRAYLVWGIDDVTHDVIGTTFHWEKTKKGNQALQPWLTSLLNTDPGIFFREGDVQGKHVVMLVIPAASHHPVRFSGVDYIRVGSHKKKMSDHPAQTKQLYKVLDENPFEFQSAETGLTEVQVLAMLDYGVYFRLQGAPIPESPPEVLAALESDMIILQDESGFYDITNLGALLFAKRLRDFESLSRKAPRVIKYKGNNKVFAEREQEGGLGYACGFEGLIQYIDNLLPRNEIIGEALRKAESLYPPLVIREVIANALIHQDFSVSGAGPMIEIYDNRMTVTNPGVPLVNPDRFVDAPPKSRNEKLAKMMRRCHLCEERGSGWDRIAFEIELAQLPAPLVRVVEGQTEVTLFAHRQFEDMDREDKVRATYLHACLRYVSGEKLTNSSVRDRFGLGPKSSSAASRIIAETVDAGLIAPYDPTAGKKGMQYVPIWAAAQE